MSTFICNIDHSTLVEDHCRACGEVLRESPEWELIFDTEEGMDWACAQANEVHELESDRDSLLQDSIAWAMEVEASEAEHLAERKHLEKFKYTPDHCPDCHWDDPQDGDYCCMACSGIHSWRTITNHEAQPHLYPKHDAHVECYLDHWVHTQDAWAEELAEEYIHCEPGED